MTGLAQSGIMYGYALLAVAASQNHAALLEQVQALNLGPALITTAKFAIAWPFVYHLFNGVRHLVSLQEAVKLHLCQSLTVVVV